MRSSSVATTAACTSVAAVVAAIHVLDHRATGDVGENFSGEPGRVEPRRDNGEDRRFSQRISKTLDRIGVHDESYHSEISGRAGRCSDRVCGLSRPVAR